MWDKHSGKGRRYELLVTESLDGQDRKYSLTNQSHRHPHGACAGFASSEITLSAAETYSTLGYDGLKFGEAKFVFCDLANYFA